ncbi:MAG: SDR family NAD(P)-dependent oxidoreductase [Aquabacterium sp.]|uniref:type I polyketide synthase n=1 Tax=Aquabacterium sp. TaxID=1872578 RepID=UPI002727AFB8|nr:type I polyketide synthase [Aquabacterium sp.]MDO9003895.1 SDR family NAD(P)-dependent oxidoreductase [Aquabacterium sp.]
MNPANDKQQDLMRRALQELRELRAKLAHYEDADRDAVAIIGVACRFPGGCDTPQALWDFLCAGQHAVAEVPAERWPIDDYYDPDPHAPGKISSRYGAFLQDIAYFDAEFFGISAREAEHMDPQQRLLLETSWQALESAGLHSKPLRGSNTGVFIGCMTQEYSELIQDVAAIDVHTGAGNAPSVMAGRLAYFYGLQGPALVVDTACSSSLLAVHLAVKGLRARDSDLALAGGINLQLSPRAAITESRAMMLAPDGLCKTFAEQADGIGRGDGVGVIVLKRLGDALRDGDPVIAVIKGSAVNHDGRSSGLTVPSERAQVAVLKAALRDAGVSATQLGYVEAHGTGTPLGDPIEVSALAEVFGDRPADQPLLLGSIKTNFGHTEGAAGIAGLIKAALMLQHKAIPPHLHWDKPSPHIPWQAIPVAVVTALQDWTVADGQRRIAGVSAFGLSGTNVHVILEAAPVADDVDGAAEPLPMLFKLSANSQPSLTALARRYQPWLEGHPQHGLAALCHAAALCRRDFSERAAIVTDNKQELAAALAALQQGRTHTALHCGSSRHKPRLAMLFTGQGAQYPGMAKELFQRWPVFRDAITVCAGHLDGLLDQPLLDLLADDACLQRTLYAQPCVFAVDYALYCLWRSWGVEPEAVIGHSLGEYVAACVAGVFSLADALELVVARARLMDQAPGEGAMLAVASSRDSLVGLLGAGLMGLDMAAVNAPQHCVLSGSTAMIAEAERYLEEQDMACRRLNVAHGFHSVLMEPVLAPFRQVLATVSMRLPFMPIVSNVTGKAAGQELTTVDYWLQHCRTAVLFADGVQALQDLGCEVFLECGPRPVLSALVAATLGRADNIFSSLHPAQGDSLLHSAAGLYAAGLDLNWDALLADVQPPARRPVLPVYPFNGKRYWLDTVSMQAAQPVLKTRLHPLLHQRLQLADADRCYYESELSTIAPSYLAEHRVHDQPVVPLAALLEMMFAAAFDTLRQTALGLRKVVIEQPLIMKAGTQPTQVQLGVHKLDGDVYQIRVFSRTEAGTWLRHISAQAEAGREPVTQAAASGYGQPVTADAVYQSFKRKHIVYGPSFQTLAQINHHGQSAYTLFKTVAGADDYLLHPVLWDACMQTAGIAVGETDAAETWLPVAIERVDFYRPAFMGLQCQAQVTENLARQCRVDLSLGEGGHPVVNMSGITFQPVAKDSLLKALAADLGRCLYQVEWQLLNELPRHEPHAEGLTLCVGSALAQQLVGKLNEAGRRSGLLTLEQLTDGLPASATALHIVYCAEDFIAADDSSASLGFLSLVQALASQAIAADVTVLSCNAVGIGGSAPCPRQSAVYGLLKTAALEYPQRRWRMLDISSLADSLLLDALAGVANEPQLALSENRCFAARLMPLPVPPRNTAVGIRKNRSYLVTGGAGALGFAVVEYLVAQGAECVVIAGRTGLDGIVAGKLSELRANGAVIVGVAADLGQDSGMGALLAALANLPPLAGVVHAAGVLNDRSLTGMDTDVFLAPWSAKVMALCKLDETLSGHVLDFFVVFSSLASLTGSPGQANYAAANAYADALMQARKQRGLPALSINWGPWRGGGMVGNTAAMMAEKGLDSIDPGQGMAVFAGLLGHSAAQVAVMPVRWPVFLAALPNPSSAFYHAMQTGQGLMLAASQDGLSRQLADAEISQRYAVLERELRHTIALVLRDPDSAGIEARQRFFDSGFDSLLAMDLTNRLGKLLAVDLPSTLLFDYPTLEALLGFLAQRLSFDVQATVTSGTAVGVETLTETAADLDECSDEQLAELLMQRLASLE